MQFTKKAIFISFTTNVLATGIWCISYAICKFEKHQCSVINLFHIDINIELKPGHFSAYWYSLMLSVTSLVKTAAGGRAILKASVNSKVDF